MSRNLCNCPNCQTDNCPEGALVERLRKALDAATDVGIYPESVTGRSLGPGVAVSGYEKRTEFMKGWNAHSLAAVKEVAKILQPGDWEEVIK